MLGARHPTVDKLSSRLLTGRGGVQTTKVLLVTGEQLEVEGSIEDVAKKLENAARSTAGTLAWLTEAATRQPLGLNATQVVTVRPGDE